MVAEAGFKIVLCHSNVDFFGLVAGGYCGSVHKARSQASSVERAIGLFPAVASGCAVVGGLWPEYFSVVAFDVCSHTVHATIANLADVSVEKLVKQVIFREVPID